MELARIDLLQRMPVFGGLEEPALRRLLERATPVRRAGGEACFHRRGMAAAQPDRVTAAGFGTPPTRS